MPSSEEAKQEQLKKQLAICDYLIKHELDLSAAELLTVANSNEPINEKQNTLLQPHIADNEDKKAWVKLAAEVLAYKLDAEHQQALQQGQTGKLGRFAISLTAALPLGALVPGLLFSLGVAISLPLHIGLIAGFFLLGMGLKLRGLNKEQADFARKYQLMAAKKQLLTDYNQALAYKNVATLQHLIVDDQDVEWITIDNIDNLLRADKPIKAAIEEFAEEKNIVLSKHSTDLLKNIPDKLPKANSYPSAKEFWLDPKLWIKRLFINSLALAATVFGGYIALFKFGYVATALAVFTGTALPYILAGIGAAITLALLAAIIYGAYKKHVCRQQLTRLEHGTESIQQLNAHYLEVNAVLLKADHLQLKQLLEQAQAEIKSSELIDDSKQESSDRFRASADALIHVMKPGEKSKKSFKKKCFTNGYKKP